MHDSCTKAKARGTIKSTRRGQPLRPALAHQFTNKYFNNAIQRSSD
jgi:hypothetical protein